MGVGPLGWGNGSGEMGGRWEGLDGSGPMRVGRWGWGDGGGEIGVGRWEYGDGSGEIRSKK